MNHAVIRDGKIHYVYANSAEDAVKLVNNKPRSLAETLTGKQITSIWNRLVCKDSIRIL